MSSSTRRSGRSSTAAPTAVELDHGDAYQRTGASSAPHQVWDIDVVNSQVVWGIGDSKSIMRSTDGGQTWQAWTAPRDFADVNTTWDPKAVAGLDATRAVVVGTAGKVLHFDAGNPTATTNYAGRFGTELRSVAARDATHWMVAGKDGLIARFDAAAVQPWQVISPGATPTLTVDPSSAGFTLNPGQVLHVEGTSSDTGLGIGQVQVLIRRSDGQYWDRNQWQPYARWQSATTSDRWAHYAYDWTVDPTSEAGVHTVEVSVRAVNANGTTSAVKKLASAATPTTISSTSSNFTFSYLGGYATAKLLSKTGQPILDRPMSLYRMSGSTPVLVKAGLLPSATTGVYSYKLAPSVKTRYKWTFAGDSAYQKATDVYFYVTPGVKLLTPRATRSSSVYSVTTYISPRHGSKAVRVYAYRYNTSTRKWSTTPYRWAYAYSYAYNSSTSRMVGRISLPRGTWRFRAYAPVDSAHAATWSSSYSTTYRY